VTVAVQLVQPEGTAAGHVAVEVQSQLAPAVVHEMMALRSPVPKGETDVDHSGKLTVK
jgi:hypothetical protein